jgi:hypothetical protein
LLLAISSFTTTKMHHQGTEQIISEQSFFHQDHMADTKKTSEQPGNHTPC